MTFFNKKEDVMRIELTPYGRELLSKGKLKPEFYAFFDDDILYNSTVASISENSSQIKRRIISDTPSLKPPTTMTGVESRFFNQHTSEDDNVLIAPIGTNKLTTKNANAWDVTAIMGNLSSSTSYISSSTSPFYNVPQIECELNFTMSVGNLSKDVYITPEYDVSDLADDDTFVKLKRDDLLLYILEKNGFLYKDSLSVEVYKYDPGEINIRKLFFDPNPQNLNDTNIIDENIVETYFNFSVDRQISNEDLCKGIHKLKDSNIYLGLKLDCEERENEEINIYQTDVTDIEDCE